MNLVRFVNEETLRLLPSCADCGAPASDGRHSSAGPGEPCRDAAGCANPSVHHLYRMPAAFAATERVPDDELPEWAR